MYFAYLDLTTIDELSNEMKSPHNVFALLVIPWLLGLRNSSTIVTVEIQWARGIREYTNLNKELLTVLKCRFRPSTLAAFYQK